MAHPNGGRGNSFPLNHSFTELYHFIGKNKYCFLSSTQESIVAFQSMAKGSRTPIISFVGQHSRHGGVCEACWGFTIDCNGSRVGQCSRALDEEIIGCGTFQGNCKPEPIKILYSRSDLEKEFRHAILNLESIIREHMPWGKREPDRRTLGYLFHDCQEVHLLEHSDLQEARFVNSVRNSLYHPGSSEISDEQLTRAIQSANALLTKLESL